MSLTRAPHSEEAGAARREHWFSTVLESIGDGVITTDLAGCVTHLNWSRDRLGLATVRTIVQQNGGALWFTSETAIGTAFEVYFPAAMD